jgi:hypothetical protein
VRVRGNNNRRISGLQRTSNVLAQFLEQKLVLRIKLDAVVVVAVLRP